MFMIKDIIVSDALFEEYFECDMSKCKGACCWEGDFGAPVTAGETHEIEKIIEQVMILLPDSHQKKIKDEGYTKFYKVPRDSTLQNGGGAGGVENDFIGTNLMEDGSCVFLVRNDQGIGLCALETLYRQGKTDWKKPISCELFPVRVNKSEIQGFEALNYYEWDLCSQACVLGKKNKVPVFKFVKNALIRKYGEEFYQEMEIAYEEMEK